MRKSARTQIPPFFDNDPYSEYITGQIYLVPIYPYGKRKEHIMQSKMMPLSDNCYISLFV